MVNAHPSQPCLPELGAMIKDYMRRNSIKRVDFAAHHYENLERGTPGSAKHYVGYVRKGWLTGFPKGKLGFDDKAERRLSRCLYLLGLNEDHQIVQEVRKHFPEFAFPPEGWTLGNGTTLAEKISGLTPENEADVERIVDDWLKVQPSVLEQIK